MEDTYCVCCRMQIHLEGKTWVSDRTDSAYCEWNPGTDGRYRFLEKHIPATEERA